MISFLLAISVSTQLMAANDSSYPNEIKDRYADIIAKQRAEKAKQEEAAASAASNISPAAGTQPQPQKRYGKVHRGRSIRQGTAAQETSSAPAQEGFTKVIKGSVAKTIFSNTDDTKRALIVFNKRPALIKASQEGDSVIFRLGGTADYDPPAVPKTFKSAFAEVKKLSADGQPLVIEVKAQPSRKIKYSSNSNMLIVDIEKEKKPEAEKSKTDEVKTNEVKAAAIESANSASVVPNSVVASFSKDATGERLVFAFKDDVPAAVFSRFGYIWFVFKTTNPAALPSIFKDSEFIASGTKVSHEYQVMKIELKKDATAKIFKNKAEWTIQLSANKPATDGMLKLSDTANVYSIETAENSLSPVEIKDDLTGDDLVVYPLSITGQFVATKKQRPEFDFLDTYQGIVFKPYGKLNSSVDKGILTIKKNVVGAPVVKPAQEAAKKYEPLFSFEPPLKLSPEAFQVTSKHLKEGDVFEYGRFLFNQQLYSEAQSALKTVSGAKARFMYAVSNFMSNHPQEAATAMDEIVAPENVDPNEILMWKAAADNEISKIAPYVSNDVSLDTFELPTNFLNYPKEIKEKVVFALTEKLIDQGHYTTAQDYLKMLSDKDLNSEGMDRKNYLQAMIFDSGENKARAYELWTPLSKNIDNPEIRAKSLFGMAMQDYALGKIKIDEAIKRLQDIRAVWRGDYFEYKLLMRIGELLAVNDQEIESLRVYREVLNNFPKFPKNLLIAAKMREIFEKAMDKGLGDKVKTFEAVSTFYEFEELKPIGPKGDEIMVKLADNLAKFDLIQDSVRILEKYLTNLTDKNIKAETGTKIAILDLLNHNPKDALDVLARTESNELPAELSGQRRKLAVQALIDLDEYDKAQSLFKFLPSEEATRFSADIMWKKKDWNKLIYSYSVLPEKSDQDIMRMAVAYVMLANDRELQKLREQYLARMVKTQYKDSFEFITNNNKVNYRDLASSLDLEQAGRFLSDYKKKISQGKLSDVTPPPVTNETKTIATPAPVAPAATPPASATNDTPAAVHSAVPTNSAKAPTSTPAVSAPAAATPAPKTAPAKVSNATQSADTKTPASNVGAEVNKNEGVPKAAPAQ